jgi:hypothetical protein
MRVKALLTVEYESAAGPWRSEIIADPTWEQIEKSIRRLDRCFFPILSLYLKANPRDGDLPDLDLIGGDGEYAIVSYPAVDRKLTYSDPSRSSENVDIWVSDQGASMPKNELCPDLDRTLAIARHYCATGELDPGADWVEWPLKWPLK